MKDHCELLLRKFKWGHSFLELNQDLLDTYMSCADGAAVIAAQQDYLDKAHAEGLKTKLAGVYYVYMYSLKR